MCAIGGPFSAKWKVSTEPGQLHVGVPTLYLDYNQQYPGAETKNLVPCFDYATIFDLLPAPSPTPNWTYYVPTRDSIWNAPYDINHLVGLIPNPVATDPGGQGFQAAVQSGNLRAVTFIIPCVAWSDHPAPMMTPIAGATGQNGPNWVNFIVNTVGESSYWKNTTIIVVWDDWGGFYDHVVPPHVPNAFNNEAQDPNEFGYRVPMLVISPYLKHPGCTDHYPNGFQCVGRQIPSAPGTPGPIRSQASILHYIEKTFSLGSLNTQDAVSDDLSGMFDFTQTPIPFASINPRDTPPTPPFPASNCSVLDIES